MHNPRLIPNDEEDLQPRIEDYPPDPEEPPDDVPGEAIEQPDRGRMRFFTCFALFRVSFLVKNLKG